MRIEMNYLNKNNEMEKVDVLGFAEGGRVRDYCVAYTEDRGEFIVPTKNLFVITKEKNDKPIRHIQTYQDGYCIKDNSGNVEKIVTTKTFLDWCSKQDDIGEILDRIINKA